jgi:mevalonate kinase
LRTLLPIINKFLSKKSKTERESISYKEAKQVGILYTNENAKTGDSITSLIQNLEQDGKIIKKLMLDVEKGKQSNPNIFKKSDISFFGYWNNDSVKDFYNSNFAFLLYPSELINPIIENILLHSKCKCRIGIHNDNSEHVFEMMVKLPVKATENQKMDAIYKYLKVL